MGERTIFVLVSNLKELEELSQIATPQSGVWVQLSPNFHQYAKDLYMRWVYKKDEGALKEIQEFLNLLSSFKLSYDASVRNKSMLYNLIAVAKCKLTPAPGLMRLLLPKGEGNG